MNRLDNVILIGMSGAGKSTLGVLLAKALGKHFTDTDILIQQKTGRLLQEIIDSDGVDRFLEIEEEIVSSLNLHDCVVATGGSVVYSDAAMHHLKAHGTTVYLSVDYDELFLRISNISDRGIVFKGKNDLRAVYEERLPLYRTYADITVECTGHGVEQSVDEITAALKKHNTRFILASKSPRRKEILESMGLHFEIVVADTDESSNESDPRALVELLSRRKGEAVRDLLLAEGRELADTVRGMERMGIVPVLAHIERYPAKDRLAALDVCPRVQMNLEGIGGLFQKGFARKMAELGLLCAVGSDMHGADAPYRRLAAAKRALGDRWDDVQRRTSRLLGIE